MRYEELTIEGRNAVLEAFRSGKTIDKLFVQDGCKDGPIQSIVREARKADTIINFVPRERLDQMSETGKHQGGSGSKACHGKCKYSFFHKSSPLLWFLLKHRPAKILAGLSFGFPDIKIPAFSLEQNC